VPREDGLRVATFGVAVGASVRLAAREALADGRCRVTVALDRALLADAREDGSLSFALRLLGEAAALDAAAAIAAVAMLHGRPLARETLARIAAALESVVAYPGRLDAAPLGDAVLIDDTYNANPRSVRASLAAARELADGTGGSLRVVLGDMRELGALSSEMHAAIGREAAALGVATLVTLGPEMTRAARAAAAADVPARPVVVELPDPEHAADAAAVVRGVLRPRDVVLVKGSRGMRMERVVDALRAGERDVPAGAPGAGREGGGSR
jgi:UDP-N-acetylmuramoyl-tripeptide--D-alanyl-D-alanine ligase